jgi:hypothetical protein
MGKLQFLNKIHFKLLGLLFIASCGLYIGIYVSREHGVVSVGSLFDKVFESPGRYLSNYFDGDLSKAEVIKISIKDEEYQKLKNKRDAAIEKGMLIKADDDYVSAKIEYEGDTNKIKMKLKGDFTDHLEGDKWSFRVKLKKKKTLMGMRVFSLQHPGTRKFLNEWIFHQFLENEGIINLRYKFVHLYLNDDDLGVYALEEGFEKNLIENNELRAGPILKFSEELLWESNYYNDFKDTYNDVYTYSAIEPYQESKTLKDSSLRQQYLIAVSLLEKFRSGELYASQVFDVDKLATFLAVTDIMSGDHSNAWNNKRFYYNPITSLLEPIGYDANCEFKNTILLTSKRFVNNENIHLKSIFEDTALVRLYISELERISDKEYLDRFFKKNIELYNNNRQILSSEFRSEDYSTSFIYNKAEVIKKIISPKAGLKVYCNEIKDNEIILKIGNIHGLPIQLLELRYKNQLIKTFSGNKIIPSKRLFEPMSYDYCNFKINETLENVSEEFDLTLHYKVLGASKEYSTEIINRPIEKEAFLKKDMMRQTPNINTFPFVKVSEGKKIISIIEGFHVIDRTMIVPKGYKLSISGNTELDFLNKASLISYSALEIVGGKNRKIIIRSSDSSGRGIAVISADNISLLDNVIIDGLSSPNHEGWSLSGAVNFYESEVIMKNSEIINPRSEDGLNIIRTKFSLDSSIFSNTQSDAFDGDFVEGKIDNCRFINCGNDGIDISGSNIKLDNISLSHVGDKAISAGEKSDLYGDNILIESSELGVVSKDNSFISINDVTIRKTSVGFSVFQKKEAYGPGVIEVKNLHKSDDIIELFLIEQGSKIFMDNKKVNSINTEDVKGKLYGIKYGKKST